MYKCVPCCLVADGPQVLPDVHKESSLASLLANFPAYDPNHLPVNIKSKRASLSSTHHVPYLSHSIHIIGHGP